MEFRILGPLEVVDDGRPISIRRGKEQALLIYLLLHANEVVPSGRLIDALWDERPPPTAPKILQNAVSHLRKELGDGRLVTRDPGYVLRVEEGELDMQRFERFAKEGRGVEALALWRGPALLDLREERFADDARRRLEEQRVAVLEDRIDNDLAAGQHAELVPELEDLIAAHPLRERPYGLLMTALYRAGRQADALDTYQRARRTLSDELGLEPGPQLQELERKILQQDPALAPRPPARRPEARNRRRIGLSALGATLLIAGLVVAVLYTRGGKSTPLVAEPNSLAIIDPSSNKLVRVVQVGTRPRGLAVDDKGVWVANAGDGTVSWFDPGTLKLRQTIGLGAEATDVAVSGDDVWVATGPDDTLVHLEARTGGIQGTLALPKDISSAAAWSVAAERGAGWVTSGDRLVKADPSTNAIAARNACCGHPVNIALSGGSVWVADLLDLIRVSSTTATVTGRTRLNGFYPDTLAVAGGSVWVSTTDNFGRRASISQINPETLETVQTIPIGSPTVSHVVVPIAAGLGSLWAVDDLAGRVLRIDPTTGAVTATIRIGGHPWNVAVGANRVWVTVD